MNFLKKYFPDSVEYPDPTKVMMESGWLLSYISSQFLSGWINYVEILDAYLITRYQKTEENYQAAEKFNQSIENGKFESLRLSSFGDDVLILAKEKSVPDYHWHSYPVDAFQEEKPEYYWFFWFDQDSSDCCIGRFQSPVTEATLRQEFNEYCFRGPTDDIGDNYSIALEQRRPIYLKLNQYKGWLTG